jgi:hypothetical protein
MGRPLRPASANSIFHVLNQANGRMQLFDDEGDYGRAVWIDLNLESAVARRQGAARRVRERLARLSDGQGKTYPLSFCAQSPAMESNLIEV